MAPVSLMGQSIVARFRVFDGDVLDVVSGKFLRFLSRCFPEKQWNALLVLCLQFGGGCEDCLLRVMDQFDL